jgi:fructose-bisphosphate aldolase class II
LYSPLVLEIETGVVGGEDDGISSGTDKLYTTPEDTLEVANRLNVIAGARYLLAATFGNVHGVYKPGQVTLKPSVLKACQEAARKHTAIERASISSFTVARDQP